jgi:hypothetical protein
LRRAAWLEEVAGGCHGVRGGRLVEIREFGFLGGERPGGKNYFKRVAHLLARDNNTRGAVPLQIRVCAFVLKPIL